MNLDFLNIPSDNPELQEEIDMMRNPSFALPPVTQVLSSTFDHAIIILTHFTF